jgi:sec-independent protein translocase protein TatA
MGGLSFPHLVILALVVLVLFGRGRISEMMGDFGKGIKSFKQGMNEETDRPVTMPAPQIAQRTPPVVEPHAHQRQQPYMAYDPVSASPTTDPAPPHPAQLTAGGTPEARPMPYDPVSAPPRDDSQRD